MLSRAIKQAWTYLNMNRGVLAETEELLPEIWSKTIILSSEESKVINDYRLEAHRKVHRPAFARFVQSPPSRPMTTQVQKRGGAH